MYSGHIQHGIKEEAMKRNCSICGGDGYTDGSAELRRDGRTGDTTCLGCDGTGTEEFTPRQRRRTYTVEATVPLPENDACDIYPYTPNADADALRAHVLGDLDETRLRGVGQVIGVQLCEVGDDGRLQTIDRIDLDEGVWESTQEED
jgi:hypothetical protein